MHDDLTKFRTDKRRLLQRNQGTMLARDASSRTWTEMTTSRQHEGERTHALQGLQGKPPRCSPRRQTHRQVARRPGLRAELSRAEAVRRSQAAHSIRLRNPGRRRAPARRGQARFGLQCEPAECRAAVECGRGIKAGNCSTLGARHRLVVVAGYSRYGRHAIRHDLFQWTAALGRWHRRLRLVLLTTIAVSTALAFRVSATAAAGWL